MSTATKNPIRIQLGQRPKSFPHTVHATLVDGTAAVIDVQYRYRTRTEFGAMLDDLVKAAEPKAEALKADAGEVLVQQAPDQQTPAIPFGQEMQRVQVEATADYLTQILDSWGLDVPLSLEAAKQLCDEQPGVARAVIGDYRAVITEGRLGN